MTSEREAMLARIRTALKTALLPEAVATLPPFKVSNGLGSDTASLIESFERELKEVGGESFQPATQTAARALVLQLIRELKGELMAWPDAELPLPGLGAELDAAGLKRSQVQLSAEPNTRRAQMPDLDRPLIGLTGALAGLADTGSLALLTGPTRSRAASLLPLYHIALLPVSRMFSSMADFMAAHSAQLLTQHSSNLVFVTGPSRTGDIEMILTRGVHGPKRLLVVFVPDAA